MSRSTDNPVSHADRATRLAVAWTSNSLAYSIVYPFLPLYLNLERGIPLSTVSLIYPIMGGASMLGPLVAGWLSDHIGRRKVLIWGPFGRALVFFFLTILAMVRAPFWAFATVLGFSAAIGTFFQVASDSYITDITQPHERPRAYGKIRIGTNIGWMVGPMLGAFLARTPFALLFAVTGVMCLFTTFYVRATCPEMPRAASVSSGGLRGGYWRILRSDPTYAMLLGLLLVLFLMCSQLYSTLSIYARAEAALSNNQIGFMYAVNGLTVILLQLPVNRLLERRPLTLCLVGGATLYSFGYTSLFWACSFPTLALSVFLITTGEVLTFPTISTYISHIAPPEKLGRYMGVQGMVRGIGYAVGPYVGAQLYTLAKPHPASMWLQVSGLGFIAALGLLLLHIRVRVHSTEAAG